MSNLIERLRLLRNATPLCIEAADEIERLNKEVDSLIELLRQERVKTERLWAELDENESYGDLTRTDRREDNASI